MVAGALNVFRRSGIIPNVTDHPRLTAAHFDMPRPHDAIRSTNDEMALVARAQRGDVGAFEEIYRATAGRVFALCLRMSGDAEQARVLTHDVYVRVWERLASFRGDSALTTWLHRVTVNVVLEQARSDSRRDARVSLGSDEPCDVEATSGGGGEADLDARIDLERAIALLPPNARRVFVMHDVQGFQHHDIAKEMAIAEGTVRAHLHRARRILMERLRR